MMNDLIGTKKLEDESERDAGAAMARVTAHAVAGATAALWCGCRWRAMFPWLPQWHLPGCPFARP